MDATVTKLHRLAKDTLSLRNSSWDGRQYTMSWWFCATQVCGESEPLLPLVHFLAISGEGLDILESMAKK
jgi:hypothetical protein